MTIKASCFFSAITGFTWEDAFSKFGFNDGEESYYTSIVGDVLTNGGYTILIEPWSIHNTVITSIQCAEGNELIPYDKGIEFGYDDPRDYLPKEIVALLERAFPTGY